jgi:hypothetical protein
MPSSPVVHFYIDAVPGDAAIVYDNGSIIGIGIAKADRTFTLTLQLSVSNHSITAAQKSTNGCTDAQGVAMPVVVS